MPVDPNFLRYASQTFRGPLPSQVMEAKSKNALLSNEVRQLPTANALQNLRLQAGQQELGDAEIKSARSELMTYLGTIANHPDPLAAAQQIMPTQQFQDAWKKARMPSGLAQIGRNDTKESIRTEALGIQHSLNGKMSPQWQTLGDFAHPEAGIYRQELNTGQVMPITQPREPRSRTVEWKDTGKQLEPVYSDTGENVPGLAPKPKTANPPPVPEMSPGELNYAVKTVMMDPTQMRNFATFGQAGQGIRQAINQEIGTRLQDSGMTPEDLARLRVNFQAQKGSIQKLTGQANAISAFEDVAKYNGQRILELIDKIDDTGIPYIEGITRPLKKGSGSVDTAEAVSVFRTFQTEVARILSNPNMTGVLSDHARQEAERMISGNLSAAQTKRVVNRLFNEMDVRESAIQDMISRSGQSMTSGESVAPSAMSTNSAPKRVKVDAQGNVIR